MIGEEDFPDLWFNTVLDINLEYEPYLEFDIWIHEYVPFGNCFMDDHIFLLDF